MESTAMTSWLEAAHASVRSALAGGGSSFAVLVGHDHAEPLACDTADDTDDTRAAYDVFRESALDARDRERLLATGPVSTLARAIGDSAARLHRCGVADVAYVAAGEPNGVACFVASAMAARHRIPRHRRRQLASAAARLSLGCLWLTAAPNRAIDLRRIAREAEGAGGAQLDGERAWSDLVRGELSPIDQFEAGGRRYIVALPVARREAPASSSLSKRELAAAELAARGYANKVIAMELGLAEQTVSTYLARAKAKLGITTRIELIRLLRASPRDPG
jgi:DNA-binding CsgD family transcriptional regulator